MEEQNALHWSMRATVTKNLGFNCSSEFMFCHPVGLSFYIDNNGIDVSPGHSVLMER